MESSDDKHWASKYLLDPLNAPQPSEETGPGSHFRPPSTTSAASTTMNSTPSSPNAPNKLSKNPYRKGSIASKAPSTTTTPVSPTQSKRYSYPSPPASASPRHEKFPTHRQEAFGEPEPTKSGSSPSSPTSTTRPRRTSSRFPGDKSHHPLAQLTAESRAADRAPHLRAKHQIGPDTIDTLDNVSGAAYHHSGPYDATLLARNNSNIASPVAALAASNAETLKATPREKIIDSVRGHRPLDGVAAYPPGGTDPNGHVYDYEPGENMMISGNPPGGAYKRWPGVVYHPDDIKGKGEPSYSVEKALKDHKTNSVHDSGEGHRTSASQEIELTSQPRQSGNQAQTSGTADQLDRDGMWGDGEDRMHRSASGREKRLSGGGLKKRFGSIKQHIKDAQILP